MRGSSNFLVAYTNIRVIEEGVKRNSTVNVTQKIALVILQHNQSTLHGRVRKNNATVSSLYFITMYLNSSLFILIIINHQLSFIELYIDTFQICNMFLLPCPTYVRFRIPGFLWNMELAWLEIVTHVTLCRWFDDTFQRRVFPSFFFTASCIILRYINSGGKIGCESFIFPRNYCGKYLPGKTLLGNFPSDWNVPEQAVMILRFLIHFNFERAFRFVDFFFSFRALNFSVNRSSYI